MTSPLDNISKKNAEQQLNTVPTILNELINSFSLGRTSSKSYIKCCSASKSYEGLLRQVEYQGINNSLDAYAVYKNKFSGKTSPEIYEFFLALPYLSYKLEQRLKNKQEIEGKESINKAIFEILLDEFKKLQVSL